MLLSASSGWTARKIAVPRSPTFGPSVSSAWAVPRNKKARPARAGSDAASEVLLPEERRGQVAALGFTALRGERLAAGAARGAALAAAADRVDVEPALDDPPSWMRMAAERMSPATIPVDCSSVRCEAKMFPVTEPPTITSRAVMSPTIDAPSPTTIRSAR